MYLQLNLPNAVEQTSSVLRSESHSIVMSGKYAFTKTLREVRFHFCQTGEGSAAIRSHPSVYCALCES